MMEGMEEQTCTLQVDGMTCDGCSSGIKAVLDSTDGIIASQVWWEFSKAEITFNSKLISIDSIISAISDVGFQAKIWDPENPPPVSERYLKLQALSTAPLPPTPNPLPSPQIFSTPSVADTPTFFTRSKLTVSIKGMTCGACVNAIETYILNSVEGVEKIAVALLAEKAEIVYNHETIQDYNTIINSINDLGFTCTFIRVSGGGKGQNSNDSNENDDEKLFLVKIITSNLDSESSNSEKNLIESIMNISGVSEARIVPYSEFTPTTNDTSFFHKLFSFSYLFSNPYTRLNDDIENDAEMTKIVQISYDHSLNYPRKIIDQILTVSDRPSIISCTYFKPIAAQPNQTHSITSLQESFIFSLCLAIPLVLLSHISMFLPTDSSIYKTLHEPLVNSLSRLLFIKFVLTSPLQFICGYKFYKGAWNAVKHKSTNMDVLIVVGTTIAYVYSVGEIWVGLFMYPDFAAIPDFFDTSAMLISFITLGRFLEAKAKGKTSEAIQKLMSLQPTKVVLLSKIPNDDNKASPGTKPIFEEEELDNINLEFDEEKLLLNLQSHYTEKEVQIELIEKGDLLKVYPGENIPTDAIVLFGTSTVNESLLTGESVPSPKQRFSKVIGGTINQSGTLIIKTTYVGEDSGLSQIIKLVENAQMGKSTVQSFADTISGYFVPVVITLALFTFFLWIFICFGLHYVPDVSILHEDGATGKKPLVVALLFAISVVVIACPCALGLATPTAVMVGTGVGAQNGILIKGAQYLELAHKIKIIIFDKTGTLTYGQLKVTDFKLFKTSGSQKKTNDLKQKNKMEENETLTEDEIWNAVAQVEKMSEHPVGKAIVEWRESILAQQGIFKSSSKTSSSAGIVVNNFENTPGQGVCGEVKNYKYYIGNRSYFKHFQTKSNPTALPDGLQTQMVEWENQGKTVVIVGFVSIDKTNNKEETEGNEGLNVAGIIAVGDTIKGESRGVIKRLNQMGIQTYMVTGDNIRTARYIGNLIGFPSKNIFSDVLPRGKAEIVTKMKQDLSENDQNLVVGFVGDGINDSPALAEADLGIAIGAGTEIAIEAASIILVKNNLNDVITAIDLSRVTITRIQMNYVFATMYNVIGIPLAMGLGTPFGVVIPPMVAGLMMAMSSVSVVCSSLLLRWYKKPVVDFVKLKSEWREGEGEEEGDE
eukprot:TRINITY_DN3989_c0_g1_i1.p1 TRINITY_DN3989_c0_g1~~TRINITY_DN3989_c0_g1_i1.p1  ORF type:complete len:1160 (+),score=279.25 TRINITY_DN3989_c0_g1_i1:32-3511(+)